jgi:hypothetical protein
MILKDLELFYLIIKLLNLIVFHVIAEKMIGRFSIEQ